MLQLLLLVSMVWAERFPATHAVYDALAQMVEETEYPSDWWQQRDQAVRL